MFLKIDFDSFVPLNKDTTEISDFFHTETGHEPYDVRINGDSAYITIKIDTNRFLRDKKINMLLD